MPTQAVKKRQTKLLKRMKGTPILIPGVNPLMYLEAVDGVHPERSEAALFVEAAVEPDIHQSTSAKKAVMNNRKGMSVPVTMKAAVVEAAAEVSAGVTVAGSVGVTAVAAEAVEVSAEVTAGVTEESPAGVTVVVAEVVEAADEAVVTVPMAKVAPKNKQGKNKIQISTTNIKQRKKREQEHIKEHLMHAA